MHKNEHCWWSGFFIGTIWHVIGICLINLMLIVSVATGGIDAYSALLTSSIVSSFIVISSSIILTVATRLNRREND